MQTLEQWYRAQPRVIGTKLNGTAAIEDSPGSITAGQNAFMRVMFFKPSAANALLEKVEEDLQIDLPDLKEDPQFNTSTDPEKRKAFLDFEIPGVSEPINLGQVRAIAADTIYGVGAEGEFSVKKGNLVFTATPQSGPVETIPPPVQNRATPFSDRVQVALTPMEQDIQEILAIVRRIRF